MSNDLTFFTNEQNATLLDRFTTILKHVKYFDILVGYFRTSGFFRLYKSFEDIEKIRILVGLNVDRKTYEIFEASQQSEFDFESHDKTKEIYSATIQHELDKSEDKYDIEIGVRKFIEFLQSGKIEIRAYPNENIHAKVYISRFPESHLDYGRVITGSSNFSEFGLVANREFNVELKNKTDVEFALNQFEDLWKDGVDLKQEYIDTIQKKTWLNNDITPYELYLKFLYEYFKEEINEDATLDKYLPDGFLELQYQSDAVNSTKRILDAYNGVFLADVVGLGKTFISALLAQQLTGKKLIICPPVLKEYWEETFREFGVRDFEVESLGKLDKIKKKDKQYAFIFIDEAHRFRNEYTQSYESLVEICFGKKIILVSATPLNNTIDDIFSQLKLFQRPKKSTIPGVPNLEAYFKHSAGRIKKAKKKGEPDELIATIKEISRDVRHRILSHIMVRRTRTDIKKFYGKDMEKNGLTFPKLANPERIVYNFDDELDSVFNKTIEMLKGFTYARYTPLLYLKDKLSEFEQQSQRNIGGFMKGILVKRLESSFYAFKKSVSRFVESYQNFIKMVENGTVYISKTVNVYEFLDEDNEDALWEYVEQDKVTQYSADEFRDDFIINLNRDLDMLKKLKALWAGITADPKLDEFIHQLGSNSTLKNKKIIMFTESKETGDYLEHKLSEIYGEKVMLYSSSGGVNGERAMSPATAKDIIKENYDPNISKDKYKDDINILITTDVLAEGINLHRSNIVMNYDLPWNPTRVLQRVGRVNRVGSKYETIHIFNFFPTAQSDAHLGLEKNITAKIQAFHDTLGEDAKYLTENEEPVSHELLGASLLNKLSNKKTYEGEAEEERSQLEYLQEIREIRDNKTDLFKRIKRLPKKSRSSRKYDIEEKNSLFSFFRKGMLKKFYLTEQESEEAAELTFFDAIDLLRCEPDTEKMHFQKDYYDLLAKNKLAFENATSEDMEIAVTAVRGGRSNVDFITKLLKANEIKHFDSYTDEDEEYIQLATKAFQEGVIPQNTAKKIANAIKKEITKGCLHPPLKILGILKKNIPDALLMPEQAGKGSQYNAKCEVILSEYLLGA